MPYSSETERIISETRDPKEIPFPCGPFSLTGHTSDLHPVLECQGHTERGLLSARRIVHERERVGGEAADVFRTRVDRMPRDESRAGRLVKQIPPLLPVRL